MRTCPVEIDRQRSATGGDCELEVQGSEMETPTPDGIGRRESPRLGFGSWTVLNAICCVGTPGFASPPHDGFAFIDHRPQRGDAKTLTRRPESRK
jgi:hypothetical protein